MSGFDTKYRLWLDAKLHRAIPNKEEVKKMHDCDYCGRSFPRKSSLTRHIKQHYEKPKDGLKNATSSSEKLETVLHNKPMWKHEYSSEFKCDQCGRMFETERSLDFHMKDDCIQKEVEQLTGPFSCAHCDQTFQNRFKHKEHQRIHTNERPYKCNRCSRRFRTQASVQTHVRRHTDSRPFQCPMCSQRFSLEDKLIIKSLRHEGKFPYPCNICNVGSRSNDNMVNKGEEDDVAEEENEMQNRGVAQLLKYMNENVVFRNAHNNEEDPEFISISQMDKILLKGSFIPKTNNDETQQNDMQIISRKIVTVANTSIADNKS